MSHSHRLSHNRLNPGGYKVAAIHMHLAFPAAICLIACIFSAFQSVSAVLTTCYDPSGDVRQDVPCYQDAVASFCCGQGWVCTNASFCIAGPTVKLNPGDPTQFESSCTDMTWNSPACPSFCRQGNLTDNAANGLWNCSGGNWCCSAYSGDTTCCERADGNQFYLGNPVNITTIGGSIGPGFSTSSPSSSTTSSTTATTTSTTSATSTASAASAISSTSSTSLTSAQNSGSSGLSAGADAGIAVGVIVGLILVVALGVLIWRNQRTTRLLRNQIEMLSSRNEVPKNPNLEPFRVAPESSYQHHGTYELGDIGMRGGTAELPTENERMISR